MNKLKENKGITLIALVITIIVLLILAGITIALITGQDSAPDKAAEARTENTKGAAKDAATMLVAEKIQDYYEGKYVNNDTTAKGASDILDYLETVLSSTNAVTRDGYVIVVADGTITATKTGESTAFVSGTVSSDGVISWNGTTGGGTQTADVDPYNGLATESEAIPELFTYEIINSTTGKVEGVDEVGKVADTEGTIKVADETTTKTAKITGLNGDWIESQYGTGSEDTLPLVQRINKKLVIPYRVKLNSSGKYDPNGDEYYIKEIKELTFENYENEDYDYNYASYYGYIIGAGRYAYDANSDTAIILPEGIEVLGDNCSEAIHGSLNVPSSVKKINEYALNSLYTDTINLPENIIIEANAFDYSSCNVILPQTIGSLDQYAFRNFEGSLEYLGTTSQWISFAESINYFDQITCSDGTCEWDYGIDDYVVQTN